LFLGLILTLAGGGCTSFGPKALERSHGGYYEAVRLVDEEQLLRNIVHVRYNESPLHLNVNSIAAQYELSGSAEARPFFVAPNPSTNHNFRTFTSILPDFMLSGSNRPTVTLDPADSADALRQFLTPISLDTLVFLTQTNWPISTVIRLWVERLNGVPNAATASGPARDAPVDFTRFLRIAELLQIAQDRELGAVHVDEKVTELGSPLPAEAVTSAALVEAAKNNLEYRRSADGKTWVLIRRSRQLVLEVHPGAEASPEMVELMGLLNLIPGRRRYNLVAAARGAPDPARFPTPPSDELSVVSRSTSQVIFFLANGVEVPDAHFCAGLVRPTVDEQGRVIDAREITRGLFEVRVAHGHKPPPTAFVAIKYRGLWYYVDDRDQASKATMMLVLQLRRLDFSRRRVVGGPLLTLPVGR
jgi:hypothetical protein